MEIWLLAIHHIREFKLAPAGSEYGISCDGDGAFVGGVPLLKQRKSEQGRSDWEPRSCEDISKELGAVFAAPIDFSSKMTALSGVACALNRDDIAHAQLVMLHMEIPDPLPLGKGLALRQSGLVKIANALYASGLVKADWDSDEHPRWPAGAPNSQGGEFAPKGQAIGPNSYISSGAESRSNGQDDNSSGSSSDAGVVEHVDSAIRDVSAEGSSDGALFDPAVYRGDYHDEVVERLAQFLRTKGLKVETELPMEMADGSGGTRIDIIAKGKIAFGIEVKTGNRPDFTEPQLYVYPHMMMGGSVLTPNPRIATLGLPAMVPLPPIPIFLCYEKDFGSEPFFGKLDPKKMSEEFVRRFTRDRARKFDWPAFN